MSGRSDFWLRIADLLDSGCPVYVVRVVDHTDHSPGTRGAMLWMSEGSPPEGTIGGGVMEAVAIERGRRWLEMGERRFELQDLHHRADAEGLRSGLICDGQQTNVTMLLQPEADAAVVARLAEAVRADEPVLLSLSPAGPESLHRDVVGERGKPGCRVLRSDPWRVEELLFERRRVAIFGGGHCGTALSRLMTDLGWRVDVWETRPEILEALARQVPAAACHLVEDLKEGGPEIHSPASTAAVVMTRSLPEDVRALLGLLPVAEIPFLGVMGAPAKVHEIRERILEAGFTPDDLSRVTAPVGLAIGSDTPMEIAVSVAAQLLQQRPAAG